MYKNIAILGSSGAIGQAFVNLLAKSYPDAKITAFSRSEQIYDSDNVRAASVDYTDEGSLQEAAALASEESALDLVLITTGILHQDGIQPEKSIRDLSLSNYETLFRANTIVPALIAKHFLPKLNKDDRAVFAALSARVGSTSDNQLGGWYAYRASKAALNMTIKNLSIEMGRRYKNAIIIGLHPGTVDSNLSEPFQSNVPEGKLFTPEYSAQKLLEVINAKTPDETGKCFDWQNVEIEP